MSTIEPPVLVLNPHVALVQTAEPQRSEVDGPDAVRDLLQAHVLADADGGHVHPAAVPADAPVGADVPDFEAVSIRASTGPGSLPRTFAEQAEGVGRGGYRITYRAPMSTKGAQ
jgi:hypothetical protein